MSIAYDQSTWIYDQLGMAWDGSAYVLPTGTHPLLPAAFVQVAFGNDPLDASPVYTTLPGVLQIDTQRGRTHELQRFLAGSASVLLDNRPRNFDPNYTGGTYGANLVPLKPFRVIGGYNLLTAQQSSLEEGTTSGWNAGSNTAIAATSSVSAPDGAYLLKMTSAASGTISANTNSGLAASPFPANCPFTAMGSLLAGSTGRVSNISVIFYDSAGSVISTSDSATATTATAAWTSFVLNGTSPATTSFAAMKVTVASTGAAGEKHYGDTFGLFCGTQTNPTWARGSLATIFTGFVESYSVSRSSQTDSVTTLMAQDLFKLIQYKLCRSRTHWDAIKNGTGISAAAGWYWRMNTPGTSANSYSAHNTDEMGSNVRLYVTGDVPTEAGPLVTDDDPGLHFDCKRGRGAISHATSPFQFSMFDTAAMSLAFWFKSNIVPTLGVPTDPAKVLVGASLPYMYHELFAQVDTTDGSNPLYHFVLGAYQNTDGSSQVRALFASGFSDYSYVDIPSNTTAILDDKWHHVVVTRSSNGKTHKLYLDGALFGQNTSTNSTQPTVTSQTANPAFTTTGSDTIPVSSSSFKDMALWKGTTLTAADALALYNTAIFPSESVSARLTRLADVLGIPGTLLALDVGPTLQSYKADLTNTSVLGHMQTVVDADGGSLFVDADGKLTYYERSRSAPTPAAVFSDAGGANEIPFIPGAGAAIDDVDVYNEFIESGDSFAPVTVSDPTSQDQYGTRTVNNSSSQLASVTDALSKITSQLARYKDPVPRTHKISYTPHSAPLRAYSLATEAELLSTIQYKEQGSNQMPVVATLFVEQIAHHITPMALWQIDYALSPF